MTGEGKELDLAEYKGKVILIVNTATKCGFTPQYAPIEKLYETYHEKGLEIIDIPCNQFGAQAPGTDEEFATHASVTNRTRGTPFYFPKPHAPWERGTNENTNGLLREFFPKGIEIDSFSNDEIDAFVDLINRRPRKCLGWKTPFEVFFNTSLHLT